jgi:dihydroxy-acid dehydratase
LTLSRILTREAFENAIKTLAAIGGSTNAVIHLIAMAGRIGLKLTVDDFDRLGSELPCLVNLQPSGKYLMEDLYYAGGLPAVLRELLEGGALRGGALTVNGASIGANVAAAPCWDRRVIAPLAAPGNSVTYTAALAGVTCAATGASSCSGGGVTFPLTFASAAARCSCRSSR